LHFFKWRRSELDVECPACEGDMYSGIKYLGGYKPCRVCKGEGMVSIKTADLYARGLIGMDDDITVNDDFSPSGDQDSKAF